MRKLSIMALPLILLTQANSLNTFGSCISYIVPQSERIESTKSITFGGDLSLNPDLSKGQSLSFINSDTYLVIDRYYVCQSPNLHSEKSISETDTTKKTTTDNTTLKKNVNVLKNYATINSIRELVREFKGKPVLIDLWASWCPACLDEFTNRDVLFDYLNKHRIEIMYVSFDDDLHDKDWKLDLQKFYLPGNHVRASKTLRDDITTTIWGGKDAYSLPHYMLIDGNGTIIDRNGINIGDGVTIYQFLEKKLNLKTP